VLQLHIRCWSTTLAGYHALRKDLIDAVKPNIAGELQAVEIRYDGAGTKVKCFGYYDGGLEGTRVDLGAPPEAVVIRFVCYDPFWYAVTDTTASLTDRTAIANADCVVRRISGRWSNISTDFATSVNAIVEATTGKVYLTGAFLNVGDANGDYIVCWDPETEALSSLASPLNNLIYAMAPAADGGVYVGGQFTDAGKPRVAKWTGAAWAVLGSGIDNGTVYALAVGLDGTLYAGGAFSNFVDGSGDNITSWNGTAWASLGTGIRGTSVRALVVANSRLYVGGAFTDAGGVSVGGIAKYAADEGWTAVGSGVGVAGGSAVIYALAAGPDGTLYAGGSFTSIDGVSASNIAAWNGTSWQALGEGTNEAVWSLAIGSDGILYAGGYFTAAGGLAAADRLAAWNGTVWSQIDVDLPGTPYVYALAVTADNDLYVGYSTTGTAYGPGETTVTNGGTAPAYPVITIARAGGTTARLEHLTNITTGKALLFNYSLQDGETLTITLRPGAKAITSSLYGNVIGRALLPNSDFAEWCLQPGANVIGLFLYEAGSPTVTATCMFTAPHWGVDGVAA
jgi:hypothetical protein